MQKYQKALIVVDMINGFVQTGPMADSSINHITAENERLIQMFLADNEKLILVKDSHSEDSAEFLTFPKHCLQDSAESEFIDPIRKYASQATIYEKNSTSALFSPGFITDIDTMPELTEIVITGCCTDICIMNLAIPLKTYLDQNNRHIAIVVPQNAVETFNSDVHNREKYNEMAFELMRQSGIDVVKQYTLKRRKK